MSQIDQPNGIQILKGIGSKKAEAFAKLGIFTLGDLVCHFPARYEDRSVLKPLSSISDGESCCAEAVIADSPTVNRIRKGLDLIKFRIFDESGMASVTIFNQAYLASSLNRGDTCIFYGKFTVDGTKRSITNPVIEREGKRSVTGHIVPIYGITDGISQRAMLDAVGAAVELCADKLPDILPESVKASAGLCGTDFAYKNIHFPSDYKALAIARRRIVFEEYFVFFCALCKMRDARAKESAFVLSACDIAPFWSALPFSPTNAQRRAVDEAVSDMRSGSVMNRLVQGDVGSGKTLVAAALIWYAFNNGLVSTFMAPTEILARQHYQTLGKLLSPFGIRTILLTGSDSVRERREKKELISAGEADLIIGTHALFSEGIEYKKLGLVITDEQHRFGVKQRAALISKGCDPHVLVMSATPIPRTLALMLYGDLDVSVINELPPGRQKIDTFAVDEGYRQRLNSFILKLCGEGRQVFVVCPKVEETEDDPSPKLKSAEAYSKELSASLPTLKIAYVHGRMKAAEKDAVMSDFADGKIDVLVATTVVEVGVDVPNAALMLIENADRFGLSQLHQLRGRVGRGRHKSYCVLVSDNTSDEAKARLKIMCQTNDGFKIAEEDLRLRGPGDFFGSRQHGLPALDLNGADNNIELLYLAQECAKNLLDSDPRLEHAENLPLSQRVEKLFSGNPDSFN